MSESYRISDGRMHGFRLGDLFDSKQDVKDISDEIKKRILAPIVQHDMALFTISVLGLQGSGKTEICKYIAYAVQTHYGASQVNTIVTDNPSVAYPRLDDKPVQLIIIDDAAQHLSSQAAGKRDEFDEWFMIRHKAEDAGKTDTGRVIAVFNWQRYSSVHPNFRNPDLWLFASPMADTDDIVKVRSRTGNIAYDSLMDNWDKIQSGDQSCKSNVMARIPAKPLPAGVGWVFTKYMRLHDPAWGGWPEMLRTTGRITITQEEALEQIRNSGEERTALEIYDAYHGEGKTQAQIAQDRKISQSYVSKNISRIEQMVEGIMSGIRGHGDTGTKKMSGITEE